MWKDSGVLSLPRAGYDYSTRKSGFSSEVDKDFALVLLIYPLHPSFLEKLTRWVSSLIKMLVISCTFLSKFPSYNSAAAAKIFFFKEIP